MSKLAKVKGRTLYRGADGERLPSVTTVLGILQKPALLEWAWKLGMEGIDYKKVRDQTADIGKIAHYMIMCHFKGEEPDLSEYAPHDIDKAENCLIKFWDWEASHHITPILIEQPLVDDIYRYGGTPDMLARVDGEITIVDYKTGKGLYPEYYYQMGGYYRLIEDAEGMWDAITQGRIIRIGRDETEGFEEAVIGQDALKVNAEIFLTCLDLYNKIKESKRKTSS